MARNVEATLLNLEQGVSGHAITTDRSGYRFDVNPKSHWSSRFVVNLSLPLPRTMLTPRTFPLPHNQVHHVPRSRIQVALGPFRDTIPVRDMIVKSMKPNPAILVPRYVRLYYRP